MSTVPLVDYEHASTEVKAIFDEIKQTRKVQDVNNFWKALANHPDLLKRIWTSLSEVMQPGALDALTKELLYVAVSITNKCEYCTYSHTAAAFAKGMSSSAVSGASVSGSDGSPNQCAREWHEGARRSTIRC